MPTARFFPPLLLLLLTSLCSAQPASEPTPDALSVAAIESRLASLPPAPKADQQRTSYRAALVSLKGAEEARGQAEELRRLAKEAPAQVARLTSASLEALPPLPQPPKDASLDDLTRARSEAESQLKRTRERLERFESELAYRTKRRLELVESRGEAQAKLDATRRELRGARGEAASPEAVAARIAQRAEVLRLEARVELFAAEELSYDARRALLGLRIDRARAQSEQLLALTAALQKREAQAREAEAQAALEAAARVRESELQDVPPLAKLAAQNHALAAKRTGAEGLPRQLELAAESLREREASLADLRQRFAGLRRKVDAAGLTRAMGRLLRLELDRLPDSEALTRRALHLRQEISDVQFRLILDEEERRAASDPRGALKPLLAQLDPAQRERFRESARELLNERMRLIEALIEDETLLLDRLATLRERSLELAAATREFRRFIGERILWVRSVSRAPWESLRELDDAAAWLVWNPDWPTSLRKVGAQLTERGPQLSSVAPLLALVLTLAFRRASRRRKEALDEGAWKEHASLRASLESFAHVLVLAAPLPLALFLTAQLLSAPPEQLELGRAVAKGLSSSALVLIVLLTLRGALCEDALAEEHFRWRSQGTEQVRRHLRWFVPVAALTTFLVTTLDHQRTTGFNESLGLLAFLVEAGTLSVFLALVLRLDGPLIASYCQRHADGWFDRLRYLWFGGAVGLPALGAGFALLGYHYSAVHLYRRLQVSVLIVLGLGLLGALLERWLGLVRLRLALAEAEERRLAKEAAKQASEEAAARGESPPSAEDEPVDPNALSERRSEPVAALSLRSRRLFQSTIGLVAVLLLGLTWLDVLPALERLKRVQLYPTVKILPLVEDTAAYATLDPGSSPDAKPAPSGAAKGAEPAASEKADKRAPAEPSLTPGMGPAESKAESAKPAPLQVTLADLALSLALIVLTVLLTRNLPALLEIAVLERLPIDAGVRFAAVTVLRYFLVLIGSGLALKSAGISWDNVQWLAAALTFGLAFGLQEIFANFVSGLIILFERPIRVGDSVTVGGVSGTVTRLRMRATTITDWDNKELIIPNREFVTGQVINWSLSSPNLRLRIPVGVAYGTDTKKVRRMLLSAARNNPKVLEDPPPSAFFLEFGDSTLNFELRVHIPHPRHRFDVRHAILEDLNRRFEQANVEISFPQQEVHLHPTADLLEAFGSDPASPAEEEEQGTKG